MRASDQRAVPADAPVQAAEWRSPSIGAPERQRKFPPASASFLLMPDRNQVLMSSRDAITQGNSLLRELGFASSEARVEPFGDAALLRGELVRQQIDQPGNLLRVIASLPKRDELLELKRQAAGELH